MAKKGQVLFTVNGFTVTKDNIYLIKDKVDGDAPSGFVRAGVSKVPNPGVDESFGFRFIATELGGNKGSWDSGFYNYSPCYENMEEKAITSIVKKRTTSILEPYRKATGMKDVFDLENQDTFEEEIFTIKTGQRLNTNNPVHVMTLYAALMAYKVAPSGSEGDSKYRESSYIVVDTTINKDQKDEKVMAEFEAIGIFNDLIKSSPDILESILTWIGIKYSAASDTGTVYSMFQKQVASSSITAQAFVELAESAGSDKGLDKLVIYQKLKEMLKSGKVTKSPQGIYYYDEHEIGPGLKPAAENIVKTAGLKEVRNEILAN